jgi:hypothetical protein
MTNSTLIAQVRLAHTMSAVTLAEALASAGPDSSAAAEATALCTRAAEAVAVIEVRVAEACCVERRQRVADAAEHLRAVLASRSALIAEHNLLSVVGGPREILREALVTLQLAGQVTRVITTSRGRRERSYTLAA